MLHFYGQDRCQIDTSGRVKLSPRFHADFRAHGDQVVLHCLPEGALGAYPLETWQRIRQIDSSAMDRTAQSILVRRQFRRFGALTQLERLSNQGRVTVPGHFRDRLNLAPGQDAVLVGCEIGVEIWNHHVWLQEFELLHRHELHKAATEMAADLGTSVPSEFQPRLETSGGVTDGEKGRVDE